MKQQKIQKEKPKYLKGKTSDTRILKRNDGKTYTIRMHRRAFLFPEQWLALRKKLSIRERITFEFLIQLGARFNEAYHIKVEDVNLENQYITLKRTKVRAAHGEKYPQPRLVRISKRFTSYVAHIIKRYALRPQDRFPMLERSYADRKLKEGLKRIGLTDHHMYSNHNLRKTHETWMCALNYDMARLAMRLGHTLGVAMKSYIREDIFTPAQKDLIRAILGEDLLG